MTQQRRILEYLKTGRTLTNADAVRLFHAYRLGGQIHELIKKGHNIVCEMEYTTNEYGDPCKYGVYRYIGEFENEQ